MIGSRLYIWLTSSINAASSRQPILNHNPYSFSTSHAQYLNSPSSILRSVPKLHSCPRQPRRSIAPRQQSLERYTRYKPYPKSEPIDPTTRFHDGIDMHERAGMAETFMHGSVVHAGTTYVRSALPPRILVRPQKGWLHVECCQLTAVVLVLHVFLSFLPANMRIKERSRL